MDEYSFSFFEYLEMSVPVLFMLGYVVAIRIAGHIRQAIDDQKISVEEAQIFLDQMKPFTRWLVLSMSFTSSEEIGHKPESMNFWRALGVFFNGSLFLILFVMVANIYFAIREAPTLEKILALVLVLALITITFLSLRFAYKMTKKLKRKKPSP